MAAWLILTLLLVLLVVIFTWAIRRQRARLLATVPVITLEAFRSERLGNGRTISVFLPPGYARGSEPYDVLYVNDGQDQEQFGLRETLARLYQSRQIQPILVVAIPANADRLQEYGTTVAPNAQGLGARAGAYAAFVTEELLPHIDETFRTTERAAFLGVSLGGLSAFDIVWTHPQLFSAVGVMSGSFWWRAGPDETATPPDELIAHAMVRRSVYRTPFRAWFQAGTRDETADRDSNGVIDAIQDTVELIEELESLGYARGRDLAYVEIENGRHNFATWAAVLPEFLRWAFGPASARLASATPGRQTEAR